MPSSAVEVFMYWLLLPICLVCRRSLSMDMSAHWIGCLVTLQICYEDFSRVSGTKKADIKKKSRNVCTHTVCIILISGYNRSIDESVSCPDELYRIQFEIKFMHDTLVHTHSSEAFVCTIMRACLCACGVSITGNEFRHFTTRWHQNKYHQFYPFIDRSLAAGWPLQKIRSISGFLMACIRLSLIYRYGMTVSAEGKCWSSDQRARSLWRFVKR